MTDLFGQYHRCHDCKHYIDPDFCHDVVREYTKVYEDGYQKQKVRSVSVCDCCNIKFMTGDLEKIKATALSLKRDVE